MNFVAKLFLFVFIHNVKTEIRENRKDWWKYTTIYEVYIWSFMDSDGDGIGDIKGIKSKLDHFVDLGVETIWISPFFKSPMRDLGYDVANYTEVDPLFGSMEDFDELVAEMKKRGLNLIVDFAINHSSDDHLWFQKSIERIEPYTDYYLWRDAKGYNKKGNPIPPNNWISIFGGSAWKWNEKRQQFYYHQFAERQPDLNLRNPVLKAELKSIMKFWFEKGVAGARLDATKHYMEDLLLRDEPGINSTYDSYSYIAWDDCDHIYTTNLWESYEFIHELREYVDANFNNNVTEIILIAEAYTDSNHTLAYFGTPEYKIAHFPFNFGFVGLKTIPSPTSLDEAIKYWLTTTPAHGVPNWVSENHDNFRTANRLMPEFMDIMVTTILTLPGIACVYYGQEIGLMGYPLKFDQIRDPNNDGHDVRQTRDTERLPMQWDNSKNGGFSSNPSTWLPVNPDYWRVNVESQREDPHSRYNMFKALSKLRKSKTLKFGNFESYVISSSIYAFSRSLIGQPTYVTVLNLGAETELAHLHHSIPNLPTTMKVHAASINSGYEPGDEVSSHPRFPQTFILRPMSAVVISTH